MHAGARSHYLLPTLIGSDVWLEHLDRHQRPRDSIVRLYHDPRRAFADDAADLVPASEHRPLLEINDGFAQQHGSARRRRIVGGAQGRSLRICQGCLGTARAGGDARGVSSLEGGGKPYHG